MDSYKHSLNIIEQHLITFYHNESNDITAAKNYVWHVANNMSLEVKKQAWLLSQAFKNIFTYLEMNEYLESLEIIGADREIYVKVQALNFLRKIYEESYIEEMGNYYYTYTTF